MTEISEVRYARSGDIDIAYQVTGSGPMDLVFVSGFISHLDLNWEFPWYNWPPEFDGFARVVMFDKRGTGLSDRSLGFGSLAERADDIRAVMDAAGVERAALWGVSEGGPLSLLFAASHPDRVSHLVVYGSAPKFGWIPDGHEGVDLAPLVDWMVDAWGTGNAFSFFIQNPSDDPAEVQRKLARFERNACTPHMVGEILRSNLAIDVRPLLETISVPTLVLHNVGDPVVPFPAGRYLAEHIPGARFIEGPYNCHGTWQDHEARWIRDAVASFLGRTEPRPEPSNRELATVLFTDIVSSTEQTAGLGDHAWRSLLDKHDLIAQNQIDRYGGRLVNTTGDGVLATFDGPARGIQCASAMKNAVRSIGVDIRAGVHTGEVELRGDDITGLGVVIARRVCDLAGTGEVLTSRTVKDLVTGSGIAFADRGPHTLKGVPDEWQLYAVEPYG